jgi:hypothetical protein
LVTNVTAARKPEMQISISYVRGSSAQEVAKRRTDEHRNVHSKQLSPSEDCSVGEVLVDPKFALPKRDWPKTAPPDSSLSLTVLAS